MRGHENSGGVNLAVLVALAGLWPAGGAAGGQVDPAEVASKLLDGSGVCGGVVVHVGSGDGRLTAALRFDERYVVHGLESDAGQVAEARRHIESLGLYGPVSVERFDGERLPYAEDLVNMVVVQDRGRVSLEEVMRVLAPGGVAWIEREGRWEKVDKPWPGEIDQWGHFLHDATNNAVARDTMVGPPRRLQWQAPPLWLRSHETPSGVQSAVTSAGRLFYIFDEGLIGITDERLPDRWSLVCRDAMNGKLLWKRPLEAWGWRQWSRERFEGKDWTLLRGARTAVPAENQRRLVAHGDRLYATLAYRGPLCILDAATGRTLATVEATRGTSEIVVSRGIAVVCVRSGPTGAAKRRGAGGKPAVALVAVDGQSGQVLWRRACAPIPPLALAVDHGRVICVAGDELSAFRLDDGEPLWQARLRRKAVRTLVAVDEVVLLLSGNHVAAHDASDGQLLWEQTGPPVSGAEAADLFVIDGLVWRGMACVDDQGRPVRKSPHALVIGWDLHSGEPKRRILVKNLRSPEHHHRCYRNKATVRYLISSYEGAEFLDFQDDNHGQNNWVRGACGYGMIPANGMLYVPPDQCFCQPGAKLLGLTALKARADGAWEPVPDEKRLHKGPAYAQVADATEGREGRVESERVEGRPGGEDRRSAAHASSSSSPPSPLDPQPSTDWPTYRHDPARHGATPAVVPAEVRPAWRTELGGRLTAPVAARGTAYVASIDAHTLYALDMATGRKRWQFTAGGRIDSPPTIHRGLVLFGAADGRVYCLRASDGQLVWQFLAAPCDRRIGCMDQLESVWPVHGSVLVDQGVAYVAAGRSTYLDGGIRLYGLDPRTGKILHRGLLEGPHRGLDGPRDLAFFLPGANSDVLVSEGGFIYMRQKKLTRRLEEVPVEVLSSKGAQDVGLHVFSTSSLLDGSWYNRTFWMYSKRWPGFQLANQAPKTGQLLVVDGQKTYALRVFYRRNVHSPMFFPAREGYLLFADWNTTEPQIVGEPGSRPPVRWLPQSDYSRGRGNQIRKLESEAFGLDKMIGYTRAEPPVWMRWLPVRVRAMVKTAEVLFVAGPPDVLDPQDPYAAFEGRRGARLVALTAADGQVLADLALDLPPVFDGMIAADGRILISLLDGSLLCLAAP